MKSQRRNRLLLVLFVVGTAGVGVGLTMQALNENINLFYSPEQIAAGEAPIGPLIRAGGMVMAGSVVRSPEPTPGRSGELSPVQPHGLRS